MAIGINVQVNTTLSEPDGQWSGPDGRCGYRGATNVAQGD
jgi:hypothetical protein